MDELYWLSNSDPESNDCRRPHFPARREEPFMTEDEMHDHMAEQLSLTQENLDLLMRDDF